MHLLAAYIYLLSCLLILLRSTPPPSKRPRTGVSSISSPPHLADLPPPLQVPVTPRATLDTHPPSRPAPNPRKRAASRSPTSETRQFDLKPPPAAPIAESSSSAAVSIPNLLSEDSSGKKRSRTNTPWTAAEEQRLKQMRDTGNTWSEIAKVRHSFDLQDGSLISVGVPKQDRRKRQEALVQGKYSTACIVQQPDGAQDMHYAEFAENEVSMQLRPTERTC